jgi:hypothetical protein
MTVREFKIKCPECEATIVIDARNGKYIRHFLADKREKDEKPDPAQFDAALDKVNKPKEDGTAAFSDALKNVEKRKVGLDDLFKDATDKANDKKDEPDRPEDHPDFWR